jgi:hypothetical protein
MENINEELKKVLLLMNYNTSNTLSENTEKISNLITEKGVKVKPGVASGAGKTVARTTKNTLGDAIAAATKLKGERKALESAFNNKLLATKSGGKKLTKADIANHKTELIRKDIDIYANTPKADGKLPSKKEINDYAIQRSQQVSKSIDAKITKQTGGKTTDGGTTGGGKKTDGEGRKKNENEPTKDRIDSKDLTKGKETRWEKFKDSIKTFSRTKTFKYLLIAGGLYLVYKWWMAEGSAPFPDCIGKNIPKEDFEQMVNSGDGSVIISDTGIDAVDRAGGGKFYDDKKFVTGNGKYTGTWTDVPGTGVVITISGQEYTMSCEGVIEDEEDTDGGDGGDGGGGYTPCSGFPLKQGCQSSDVRKVQECLGIGADGKLGPKTASSIKAKGYSVPLSQSDYNKIVADCGGSSSSSTTTTTTVYTGGEEGSIENFV